MTTTRAGSETITSVDQQPHQGARILAVDTLKAALVGWIIGCHAIVAYTRVGGWPYDEVHEVTVGPRLELVLSLVLGPSGLFVIGTFFFLAGLFAPAEVRRHQGARGFAWSRVVRLGVPWVLFTLLVWPSLMWLAYRSAGSHWSWWQAFLHRTPFLDSGPLWFVQVLLYVSLGYALWARFVPRKGYGRTLVRGRHLVLVALLVAASSYLVRIWFPARSQQVLDLHLWQWPQCVAMFCLGVAVSGQGWARRIPHAVLRCCSLAVAAALLLGLGVVALEGLSDFSRDGVTYLGGGTWQSALLALLEGVLVVAASLLLLAAAQRWGTGTSRLSQSCRRGAFAAYLLQAPVLIGLEVLLRPVPAPAAMKAAAGAVVAVVACFTLGARLVRRPSLRRVL